MMLRPSAIHCGDDYYADDRVSCEVVCAVDDLVIDTGLLDQHGDPIRRRIGREPVGFRLRGVP